MSITRAVAMQNYGPKSYKHLFVLMGLIHGAPAPGEERFKPAAQLSTIVIGDGAASCTKVFTRNRWPSRGRNIVFWKAGVNGGTGISKRFEGTPASRVEPPFTFTDTSLGQVL